MIQTVLLLAVTLLFSDDASARPEYAIRLPNGGNVPNFARLGHVTESLANNNLNPFGRDFQSAGLRWTVALCQRDSDGDGFSNGYELGDPSCLWTAANPTPLRTTDLSAPGIAASAPATTAPTQAATKSPTSKSPTSKAPTLSPTTGSPTATSSPVPPTAPTLPTLSPTKIPSASPTFVPSASPSSSPPSSAPTTQPSTNPTLAFDSGGSGGDGGGTSSFTATYAFSLWTAHAVIMSIAFGFFLPIGVIIPAITGLRKRPDSMWFKLHRAFMSIFLLLAWIGFLIALFTVAMSDQSLSGVINSPTSAHGPLGVALIVIISVQALLGIFRPHVTEIKAKKRIVFEFVHHWMGRSIVLLAATEMFLGLQLLRSLWIQDVGSQDSVNIWAYVQAIAMPIFVFVVVVFFKCTDKSNTATYSKKPAHGGVTTESNVPPAAHAGGPVQPATGKTEAKDVILV